MHLTGYASCGSAFYRARPRECLGVNKTVDLPRLYERPLWPCSSWKLLDLAGSSVLRSPRSEMRQHGDAAISSSRATP